MELEIGKMLVDLLTKPISREHFDTIVHVVLGNHRYACSSNRGAKSKMSGLSVETVKRELAGKSCLNHTLRAKKHKTSK